MVICMIIMLPLIIWYGRGLFSDQSGTYLLGYSTYFLFGLMAIRATYLIIGWSTRTGTLGCLAMQIKVTTLLGERISAGRAGIRYLALLVSTALFALGWITILLTPKRQAVHDYLAGTIVVDRRFSS